MTKEQRRRGTDEQRLKEKLPGVEGKNMGRIDGYRKHLLLKAEYDAYRIKTEEEAEHGYVDG